MVLKPPRLRPGDLIGLVSPASAPSSSEMIEQGVRYLERLGYRVKVGEHAATVRGYLAGTDDQRATDLNEMIRDQDVKAIIAVRGGYGSTRILSMIDYKALKRHPKIIVGYSDITALQLAIFCRTGLVTISGPMSGVEMLDNIDPYTEESFWRVVTSRSKIGELKNPAGSPLKILRAGVAVGRILGGNLATLSALLGTSFAPGFKETILILEDIDEAPHRIDRMLSQLQNARILEKIAGLVFGKFTDCVPTDPSKPFLTVDQILDNIAHHVKIPVVSNLQYGHIPKKLTIPIGVKAKVDAKKGTIEVLEGAVV
jgi:muramoyltetrapeptide carboxypeptidase